MGLKGVTYESFRRFLCHEGCEEAFDRAFLLHNGHTLFDRALWEASEPLYIIAHAFDWSATPEGRGFWLALDRKWYNTLTN